MRAADSMSRQRLRAATYRTLIGLLAVTGMRAGEAVRLNREHVNLETGVLTIIDSKYGKSRQVLLHASTVAALRDYSLLRDATPGTDRWLAFFVSRNGRLIVNTIDYTFADLLPAAGIRCAPGEPHPRIHDFRHSFAIRTLLDWYRSGADVQAQLPLLSTWLGHISPASTYWYLKLPRSCWLWPRSVWRVLFPPLLKEPCHGHARAASRSVLHRPSDGPAAS